MVEDQPLQFYGERNNHHHSSQGPCNHANDVDTPADVICAFWLGNCKVNLFPNCGVEEVRAADHKRTGRVHYMIELKGIFPSRLFRIVVELILEVLNVYV